MPSANALSAALAVLAALAAAAGEARAHDESVSTSDVVVAGDSITWRVGVGVGGLGKIVELPATEGELDEAALRTAAPAIGRALAAGLTITADGRTLPAAIGTLEPRYEAHVAGGKPDLARVVQTLSFRAGAPIATVHARVRFFAEVTSQHRALIQVQWDQQTRRFVRNGPTELTLAAGETAPRALSLVGELLRWGMFHIFRGFDHIAFLLALLLAATRVRELVSVVTAFTVAHSLTLLLATLDVLRVPVRLTEVLIAASIVYIAAENLAWRGTSARATASARYRWVITFAFGLVHGCGFATEIKDRLTELGGNVALPVIAFNLGVELGQLAIVALVYPLLAHLRRAPNDAARAARQRRILIVGSLPVLLAGLYWLLERLTSR